MDKRTYLKMHIADRRAHIAAQIKVPDVMFGDILEPEALTSFPHGITREEANERRYVASTDGTVREDLIDWGEASKQFLAIARELGDEELSSRFSAPEQWAIYDHWLNGSQRIEYQIGYWLSDEGVKLYIGDRYTNVIEHMGLTIKRGIAVMNLLRGIV